MVTMSLYDGVGIDDKKSGLDQKMTGWADNLQFMKTQLQLKKAVVKPTTTSGIKASRILTTTGPGNVTLASLTGTTERPSVVLNDEYNPLKPNDYHEMKGRLKKKEDEEKRERERKERVKREEEERDLKDRSKRRRSRSRSREKERDRERDRPKREEEPREPERRNDRGGAAIAPPPSLVIAPVDQAAIVRKDGAGTGGFSTGNTAASTIMAKYGWKEGQGLGRDEQGLSTALTIEKTGKRAGKIVNKDVEKVKSKPKNEFTPPRPVTPPMQNLFGYAEPAALTPPRADDGASDEQKESSITEMMRNPSKVVMLKNMVGPGEVDEELQSEIEEECTTKYGEVTKVIIFEIPNAVEEEAVRIFVEFKRMESAVKAIVDLNGRFFGGRVVTAAFYNLDRFRRLDLAG